MTIQEIIAKHEAAVVIFDKGGNIGPDLYQDLFVYYIEAMPHSVWRGSKKIQRNWIHDKFTDDTE